MTEAPDVRELVQEADLGRRKPVGIAATILAATCIGWSILQLWYASPLPFTFNLCVSNVPGPRETLYLNGSRLEATYPVSIPMHGIADSLNVSVAAAVLLYEARRQRDRSQEPPD